MKAIIRLIAISVTLLSSVPGVAQEIQMENLSMKVLPNTSEYSKTILKNEMGELKSPKSQSRAIPLRKKLRTTTYGIFIFS